ncbi:MAG: type I glyceraldehyde-3-phosphate dehydrogenase [Saprospiraceae bacterium]|nr:type I glyceraldehyde-3-phosphate dehydrogenase [Saprospiraceae bacterium]
MVKKRIAINGFGRIGRMTLKNLLSVKDVEVVAINDLTKTSTLAHLFRYDSVHGRFRGEVEVGENKITIDGTDIQVFAERDPANLPWRELEVDIVLECTGFFRKREQAAIHLEAGAKRVILSAPAKSKGVPTIVRGINENIVQDTDTIISNASCTTNCLAPLVKVIDSNWGIEHGFMSTVHAYTGNQRLVDAPHKDLRRGRAAGVNMIPTTTGAAKALALVMPSMKGKIKASSIRVPVPSGSLVDLVVQVKKNAVSSEEVNRIFKISAQTHLKGILEYCEDPIVSSDILSNPYSSILDAALTEVHHNMIKVVAWYDNEAGYSARLSELATIF